MNNVVRLFEEEEFGGGGGDGFEEIVCAACEMNTWKIYWDEHPLIICQNCGEEHSLPAYEA